MASSPYAGGAGSGQLPPIDFEALARALLDRADNLVPAWLPDGVQRGHEYQCGDLTGGAGSSTSVNLTTGKWADFSTGEQGGDLLALYAAIHGLTMGKAAVQVAREQGLESVAGIVSTGRGDAAASALTSTSTSSTTPPKPGRPAPVAKVKDVESWTTVQPAPEHVPAPTFWHFARNCEKHQDVMDHCAEYRVGEALYGYVVRFLTSTGDKETLPYTWCTSARDGTSKWHWRTWDEPRPLYYPNHSAPAQRTVVLVEGEKKADALQRVLDDHMPNAYCVASWAGGCKAWKKANWAWLHGCTVLLWPDCDAKRQALTSEQKKACLDDVALDIAKAAQPLVAADKQPGMAAMLGIGALLRDTHGCTVQLLPIPEPLAVPDGWDCADAINTDSWDGARVLAFFATARGLLATVQGDALGAESGKAKKIDRLVDTEAGDLGDGGNRIVRGFDVPEWLARYFSAKKQTWFTSRNLVIDALQLDPALQNVLGFNELKNQIQTRALWPWPHAVVGDLSDSTDLLLGNWLSETYGVTAIARASLSEGIQTVAATRRFHPFREYLEGLTWDGKERIDKWLMHVMGETPDTLGAKMQEYLHLVGRFWMLGMVNRVMEPGCKFDYCPVLEGVGGLRKSTLVRALATKEFFSDTPFQVGRGKEAQEQVQGLVLYEIAELTHFSRAEVQEVKGFISSMVDRYRVAYGSTVGTYPRQCVLVGTTNENTYLRDRTGNRRFWPVPVRHVINTDWVDRKRDQLFAEAYALYKEGAVFHPNAEQEKRLFVLMQESRLAETASTSKLLEILTRDPGTGAGSDKMNNLTDFFTIAQIMEALQVDAGKSTAPKENEVKAWLAAEGWEYRKKQINKVRVPGYHRPVSWHTQDTDDAEDMEAAPLVKPITTAASTTMATSTQPTSKGDEHASF